MEEAERLCDRVAIIDHGRIIDIGSPAALVARHCPERTVVIVADDADGRASACERIAGVEVGRRAMDRSSRFAAVATTS